MKIASITSVVLIMSALSLGDDSCEKLSGLKIPNATITSAQSVAAGSFVGPPEPFSGRDISALYKTLPAFCRVVAEAKPTSDSDIKLEVWLPASGWNGKLQGIGNGGFAGLIDTAQIAQAMKSGYAATATDTGHTGSPIDAAWAMGHPEKVIDFGHRGIHEMTRVAKAVTEATANMGDEADAFLRLYLAPGVQHCGGGPGPDSYGEVGNLTFDDPAHSLDAALERWVEKGTAPVTIIASKFSGEDRQHATMTRPLCPYPQAAKYKGSGDPNDAANFVCATKLR